MSWGRRAVDGQPGVYGCPDGRYEVRYRDSSGQVVAVNVGDDLAAAIRARDEIRDLRRDLRQRGKRLLPSTRRLDQLADDWLAEVERRAAAGELTLATVDSYRNSIQSWIKPGFLTRRRGRLASKRVRDIFPYAIADFLVTLEARGLAPSTRDLVRRTLRQLMEYAIRQGDLDYNPVDEYRRRANRAEDVAAAPAARHLSPDELSDLLEAADERWRLAFTCAVETGLHASELLALRQSDLSGDTVHVTRHLDRAGTVVDYPEDDARRRTISVTPTLRHALDAQRASTEPRRTSDMIFPSKRSGVRRSTRSYDLAFKCVAERIGLSVKASVLRHTFAAARIRVGVDFDALTRQLGNASFETVYQNYRGLIEDNGRGRQAQELRRATFTKNRSAANANTA